MKNMPYGAVLAIWVWCAICSRPMFGFMMFFPAAIALLWWAIKAIWAIRQPENWRQHKIIGAAWLIGLAACFAINAYYVYAAEQEMRQVVADIERYRAQHGKYPDKLDDTGTRVKQDMQHARYGKIKDTNQVYLVYKVPYIIFDYYRYDFQTKQWEQTD